MHLARGDSVMRAPTTEEVRMLHEARGATLDEVPWDDASCARAPELVQLGWLSHYEGAEDDPDDDEMEFTYDAWTTTADGELVLRIARALYG
jgi:hypothetical protein